MTLVSGNIRFMRIFAWVLSRGDVKRQWGNRKRYPYLVRFRRCSVYETFTVFQRIPNILRITARYSASHTSAGHAYILAILFMSIASILPVLFVIWYCCQYCNIFFLLCIAIQMAILFIFFFHSLHTRSTWHCINREFLCTNMCQATDDGYNRQQCYSCLLDKSCELSSLNH